MEVITTGKRVSKSKKRNTRRAHIEFSKICVSAAFLLSIAFVIFVSAPADARIMESGTDEEIGNYLVLDLGDGYTVTCGQMKEVQAAVGEYLEKGQVLGYVAEPTKYYTLEGPNIYLKLEKDGTAVDPLDYLE